MCKEADLDGFRSNHSQRATAATRLYENGVDEQPLVEITGYRRDAVRGYKRTNDVMQRNVSGIIRGGVSDDTKPSTCKMVCIDECELDVNINVNGNISKY